MLTINMIKSKEHKCAFNSNIQWKFVMNKKKKKKKQRNSQNQKRVYSSNQFFFSPHYSSKFIWQIKIKKKHFNTPSINILDFTCNILICIVPFLSCTNILNTNFACLRKTNSYGVVTIAHHSTTVHNVHMDQIKIN